jgi:hypothetical protein
MSHKRKPIVIYTYDFDLGIGGIKVLHHLCHLLNESGRESYLMPIYWRDEFITFYDNTPIVTEEIIKDLKKCIVVYPEIIKGNPLNSDNVIRWMLGPLEEDKFITYGKNDKIFWYMDYYYTDKLGHRDNKLFVSEFHEEIFYDKGLNRDGSAYCIRKCQNPEFVHPRDSVEITRAMAGNYNLLSEIFNSIKTFYCYDNYTFLAIQAALCGCISVVIPDKSQNKSPDQWRGGSDLTRYGIAYGLDEIPRAIETFDLFRQEIDKIKLSVKRDVLTFIEKCDSIFN